MSRRMIIRTPIAALAMSAVALTGCSGNLPSSAAVVGDRSLTQTQVSEGVDGLAQAFGVNAAQVNVTNVVGAMISGLQAEQIAARHGIVITDTERIASLGAQESGQALLANPVSKQLAFDLADAQLVAQKVGVQNYLSEAAAIPVKLNPRYGSFENGQMTGQSGSLSQAVSPESQPGG